MKLPTSPGIYIVTLNNYEPISVNADDARIADKAIKATRANIKVGKTKNLAARVKGYQNTFGAHNVNFHPIAETNEPEAIEKLILARLDHLRIKGRTGRKNEWLHSISPSQALAVILEVLHGAEYSFELLTTSMED